MFGIASSKPRGKSAQKPYISVVNHRSHAETCGMP